MDDQTARKKWTTLRDYFKKAHKQVTTIKSGAAADKRKKWYLYDNMMFLLPHLTDRKTCSNLSDCANDDEESIPSLDSSVAGPSRPASLPDLFELEYSQSQPTKSGHEQGINPSRPTNCVSRKRKANFPRGHRESLDDDILRAIKNIGDKSEKVEKEKDEDMLFFESLVPKMKHLDPLKKMECQAEIHMLVLRYVRNALTPQTQTSSHNSRQTVNQYTREYNEPHLTYYHNDHYQTYTSQ